MEHASLPDQPLSGGLPRPTGRPARAIGALRRHLRPLVAVAVAAGLAAIGLALVRESGGAPAVAPGPIEVRLAGPSQVREPTFTLELPAGWRRADPPGGASFAAVSGAGDAEATLWVKRDPGLDLPSFVTRSLARLETLAGSARVAERVPAPTPEDSVVVLAADAPAGQPTYEATLRVAGPYRYYLATSADPGAAAGTLAGAAAIGDSLHPRVP